jgi:hypothetical protein
VRQADWLIYDLKSEAVDERDKLVGRFAQIKVWRDLAKPGRVAEQMMNEPPPQLVAFAVLGR